MDRIELPSDIPTLAACVAHLRSALVQSLVELRRADPSGAKERLDRLEAFAVHVLKTDVPDGISIDDESRAMNAALFLIEEAFQRARLIR